MNFETIWGGLGYVLAVFVAVVMVAWNIPHKKRFVLRLIVGAVVLIVYKNTFDHVMRVFNLTMYNALLLFTLDAFVVYLLSMLGVWLCFDCNIWAMLFCSTVGYCMQHMSQRVYLILEKYVLHLTNPYVGAVLLCAVTALFYVGIYYLFIRKVVCRGEVIPDNKVQITVSVFAIAVTIFLNSYALKYIGYGENAVFIMLFSIITAILVIYIEFGWLAAKNAEIENDVMRRIAKDTKAQYDIEKETIEQINFKAHDLRHQLSALGGRINDDEANSINQTVAVYDSIVTTGNRALDVFLTGKALSFEKEGISFTCLIDGEKLSCLTESELYSLFGNLMDNATEAVLSLDDAEKKIICLTSQVVGDRIVITEENYYSARGGGGAVD